MITLAKTDEGNALFVDLEFPWTSADHYELIEQVNREVDEVGHLSLLIECSMGMEELGNSDSVLQPYQEDEVFGVDRLAVVGAEMFKETVEPIIQSFHNAQTRYFMSDERRHALEWVTADL